MINPTESQEKAIDAIVKWYSLEKNSPQEFYLAGYAGTGKSTTVNLAIDKLKDKCDIYRIRVGTYTGKAANILRKKGVRNAQTIHSMIYTLVDSDETGRPHFELNPDGDAANADLIILDECSMVSEEMADDLRSFNVKLLVMGDPGQLPPVSGQGAFTKRDPDFFLSEIHRQAADSPIIQLATLARKGLPISIGDYGDFVKVQKLDINCPDIYDPDYQVICGTHKVRHKLSQRIRNTLSFDGPLPIQRERIICCKNNRELGIFNGGLGVMTSDAHRISSTLIKLDVQMEDFDWITRDIISTSVLFDQHFDGNYPSTFSRGIDQFDWSYVLTCHKSQGSEYESVTVIDDSASFREHKDRWLYTALTRAASRLTLLKRN